MYMSLYGDMLSFLLGKCLGVEWPHHMVGVFNFFKKLPKWLWRYVLPPAVNESSSCSIALPTLGVVSLFNFRHSNTCAVIAHVFNLHFPND